MLHGDVDRALGALPLALREVGLVSTLDDEALLECADRLRAELEQRATL